MTVPVPDIPPPGPDYPDFSYESVAMKDRLVLVQSLTIERNGMGVPIYEDGLTP